MQDRSETEMKTTLTPNLLLAAARLHLFDIRNNPLWRSADQLKLCIMRSFNFPLFHRRRDYTLEKLLHIPPSCPTLAVGLLCNLMICCGGRLPCFQILRADVNTRPVHLQRGGATSNSKG